MKYCQVQNRNFRQMQIRGHNMQIIRSFSQKNQDSQIIFDAIDLDFLLNETDNFDQTGLNEDSKKEKEYKEIQLQRKQKVLNLIGDIKRYNQSIKEIKINKQTQPTKKWQTQKSFNLKQVRKNGSSKKFVSRRIYLCGACLLNFNFKEELLLHIQRQHSCQAPEGTIFGSKKEKLFKLFNIPYIKSAIPMQRKIFLFKCGCGNEYNCSYLLSFHIKISHNNIEPIGTIGILRSIKIYQK